MHASLTATRFGFLLVGAMLSAALAWSGGSQAVSANPGEQTTIFRVEGMTCSLCGKAIQKNLAAVDGVREVTVDRPSERVTVFSTPDVSPETLEAAIESAGSYRAEIIED